MACFLHVHFFLRKTYTITAVDLLALIRSLAVHRPTEGR